MSEHLFGLSLRLTGRRVTVVGGGHVAARRIRSFLDAGAEVVVIAPHLAEEAAEYARHPRVSWVERRYRTGDLQGSWLVQTATADPDTDALVAQDAEEARIWCLKGGDPERATAWMPATADVGDVTIAVNTDGDARRASTLRDAIVTALETGELPLRHRTHHPGGRVILVGGGPGDPGLLTTRGRQLLAEADVVVVDRLAPRAVLARLDPDVEVIDVGKRRGDHVHTQAEINQLLVDKANEGRIVVRLKGGDPYVFGRGGEELLACREAGVAVEVVPGVTSAAAVPAAADIPLTHRGVARGFSVVTGHTDLGALPPCGDHTLILMMAIEGLGRSTDQLIASGHAPDTPAAIIERGFAPDQRVTRGSLADIAQTAERLAVAAPAVVVIGSVVDALR